MDRQALVIATAISAHAKLCAGYQQRQKPYIKETKDAAWVEVHGTNQVDLCATALDALPQDWYKERIAGSEIAVDALLDAEAKGRDLDANFIEEASELLHRKWLERNSTRASDIQKFDYAALPEVEKEKDRYFIVSAIEVSSAS